MKLAQNTLVTAVTARRYVKFAGHIEDRLVGWHAWGDWVYPKMLRRRFGLGPGEELVCRPEFWGEIEDKVEAPVRNRRFGLRKLYEKA